MRHLRWLVAGGLAIWVTLVALASVGPATAIPAWSRKYNVDCVACHNAGFRLNRMGQDFLRSGHYQ